MKQKHLLRTFSALALAMCISFSIAVPTGAASAGTAQGNTLAEVLERAAANGFCYRYDGDDQVFDGSRIVNGTAQDISRPGYAADSLSERGCCEPGPLCRRKRYRCGALWRGIGK